MKKNCSSVSRMERKSSRLYKVGNHYQVQEYILHLYILHLMSILPWKQTEKNSTSEGGTKMFFDYKKAQRMKELYPGGTRIRLISMNDPYAPIAPGTEGTVDFVDDIGTLHCTFDDGRVLGVIPSEDSFSVISLPEQSGPQESENEQFGMKMG